MSSFWKHVNKVIEQSDILIEVLDARLIQETRNQEVEQKIRKAEKKLLFVINKSDLLPDAELKTIKKRLPPRIPCVFISSKKHLGTTILLKKILELNHGKPATVGILGYPNVGKSSLINALAGRAAAKTSSESGYTKGLQKVRVNSKILLLDSPGVFPVQERRQKDQVSTQTKYAKTGSIDYAKIKEPEPAALQLIISNTHDIVAHFSFPSKVTSHIFAITDKEEQAEFILEQIALIRRKIHKGNEPNLEAAARLLLKEWQTGKIKKKTNQQRR